MGSQRSEATGRSGRNTCEGYSLVLFWPSSSHPSCSSDLCTGQEVIEGYRVRPWLLRDQECARQFGRDSKLLLP